MSFKIAVLPGDGIGREVMAEATQVLQQAAKLYGFAVELEEGIVGGASIDAYGKPLTDSVLKLAKESDAVLLGAVGATQFDKLPQDRRPEAGLLQLRIALGGYANLRPAIAYNALTECSPLRPAVVAGANVLFVRELLGGLYFGEPRGIDTTSTRSAWNTMRSLPSPMSRSNVRN